MCSVMVFQLAAVSAMGYVWWSLSGRGGSWSGVLRKGSRGVGVADRVSEQPGQSTGMTCMIDPNTFYINAGLSHEYLFFFSTSHSVGSAIILTTPNQQWQLNCMWKFQLFNFSKLVQSFVENE
ncbi:hypothetical protein BKA83DRAFT_4127727 [Pisolithus microcarpus]|nr:hypothetical protein BKA83DRAFT_4127727 [Pisolithus microcarpus]